MPIRTQPFVVHLHCVDSSSVARPLPPSFQFEPKRSFLPSTVSIRAQSLVYPLRVHHVIRAQPLVSYPYHVNSSVATRVPPQPGPFERDPSFPTHTMSIHSCPTFTVSSQARSVVSHPYRVNSSTTAHLPPPLCPLELDCSPPTPTMSIRAQLLVSHPDHVPSGPSARLSPRLCLFKLEHICHLHRVPSSPGTRLPPRARVLVSHPNPSSLGARLPPRPRLFKPECSSLAPTVSIRARTLVSRLNRAFSSPGARHHSLQARASST